MAIDAVATLVFSCKAYVDGKLLESCWSTPFEFTALYYVPLPITWSIDWRFARILEIKFFYLWAVGFYRWWHSWLLAFVLSVLMSSGPNLGPGITSYEPHN